MDTAPLARLLCEVVGARPGQPIPGIIDNLADGSLSSVALVTIDYSTGQTVRWFQGGRSEPWEGPNRRTVETEITVDHVLASSALPFLFPAGRTGHGPAAQRDLVRFDRRRRHAPGAPEPDDPPARAA